MAIQDTMNMPQQQGEAPVQEASPANAGTQNQWGMDPFDAPIPGESLTSSPDQRLPFEKPPRFTDVNEATEEIFLRLTEEETLDEILDLMREEVPVEDITQVILFEGFRQGNYTPDLMLLLAEPTMYILLALANYAQIDAVLYPEEDFDSVGEEGEMAEDTLTSFEEVLRRRREGGNQSSDVTVEDDSITVGARTVSRPDAVSPSLLDDIQARVGAGE